jgi:hypothetical protein
MRALLLSASVLVAVTVSIVLLTLVVSRQAGARSFATACGCTDIAGLTDRLKAVEATLREIAARSTGPAARGTFDSGTFDSGLGEAMIKAQFTAGGMTAAMPIADIDRNSCQITNNSALGGSACLLESFNAQLNVRRQACMQGRTGEEDYWEGRPMSAVLAELTNAYTAEADFLRQQIATLNRTCTRPGTGPSTRPAARPTACGGNCVQYIMDGTRAFPPPIMGIHMFSNSTIPFTVSANGRISGSGTIVTGLELPGSSCRISGYEPNADILVDGQVTGGILEATVRPKGQSQTTSAAIKIVCPPGGFAQEFPQQQYYVITQKLRVPGPREAYTEETIDLGAQTQGAMFGTVVLRLYMTR